jgi:hypothetical protein
MVEGGKEDDDDEEEEEKAPKYSKTLIKIETIKNSYRLQKKNNIEFFYQLALYLQKDKILIR